MSLSLWRVPHVFLSISKHEFPNTNFQHKNVFSIVISEVKVIIWSQAWWFHFHCVTKFTCRRSLSNPSNSRARWRKITFSYSGHSWVWARDLRVENMEPFCMLYHVLLVRSTLDARHFICLTLFFLVPSSLLSASRHSDRSCEDINGISKRVSDWVTTFQSGSVSLWRTLFLTIGSHD